MLSFPRSMAVKEPKKDSWRILMRILVMIIPFIAILGMFRIPQTYHHEQYHHEPEVLIIDDHAFKADIRDPVSAGVAKLTDDPALSLTAYFSQPLETIRFVKIRYGAYLEVKGPSPDGKGVVLQVKTPPMMLPGFTIRPIVTCVAYHTGASIVIEGTEVFVADNLAETITSFRMRVEASWTDTPDKQEVNLKGSIRLGLGMPDFAKAFLPEVLFEKIGTAAVKGAMDIMLRSFARSFAEDYDKWANDEIYRNMRYSSKAVLV